MIIFIQVKHTDKWWFWLSFYCLDYSFYPGSNLKKSDFTFDDIPADDFHDLEDIRVEDLLFVDNFESSSSEAEENVHISFSDQSIKVDKYEEQVIT